MKIIADENIPLIGHYFSSLGELILKRGREISREDVIDADILLVRSITDVNEKLLNKTLVKYVGSATAGSDHLDVNWLDEAGIAWDIASGCNAEAVAEYVVCTIAALQKKGFLLGKHCRAGVVGVGHVGKLVVSKLTCLGFEVVQCDPPRALKEKNFISTDLNEFQELDFISLHTPLIYGSDYPTHRLIDKRFLERQKKDCVLLNAGRGAVIDSSDLKTAGKHLHWCLDVFENEPTIDHDILQSALMTTPHIAGYSIQSKYRGIEMIYQMALKRGIIPDTKISKVKFPSQQLSFQNHESDWREVVLKIYDPFNTSEKMKDSLLRGIKTFDDLRKHFIDRNEFEYVIVEQVHLSNEDRGLLKRLGVKL